MVTQAQRDKAAKKGKFLVKPGQEGARTQARTPEGFEGKRLVKPGFKEKATEKIVETGKQFVGQVKEQAGFVKEHPIQAVLGGVPESEFEGGTTSATTLGGLGPRIGVFGSQASSRLAMLERIANTKGVGAAKELVEADTATIRNAMLAAEATEGGLELAIKKSAAKLPIVSVGAVTSLGKKLNKKSAKLLYKIIKKAGIPITITVAGIGIIVTDVMTRQQESDAGLSLIIQSAELRKAPDDEAGTAALQENIIAMQDVVNIVKTQDETAWEKIPIIGEWIRRIRAQGTGTISALEGAIQMNKDDLLRRQTGATPNEIFQANEDKQNMIDLELTREIEESNKRKVEREEAASIRQTERIEAADIRKTEREEASSLKTTREWEKTQERIARLKDTLEDENRKDLERMQKENLEGWRAYLEMKIKSTKEGTPLSHLNFGLL